jgi:hypothetical protein
MDKRTVENGCAILSKIRVPIAQKQGAVQSFIFDDSAVKSLHPGFPPPQKRF